MNKPSALIFAGVVSLALMAGTLSRGLTIQQSHAAAAPFVVQTAPAAPAAPVAPAAHGNFETEGLG